MKPTTVRNKVLPIRRPHRAFIPLLLLVVMMAMITVVVWANGEPLDIAGYYAFTYGTTVNAEPTADSAQSKIWWNDGRWWGILWNRAEDAYFIYWLDETTQQWMVTNTAVDPRLESRADVLWDPAEGDGGMLYVASHFKRELPSYSDQNEDEWARLYRYTYNPATKTYTLVPGKFGDYSYINGHITRTLVIDKADNGWLWATFVSNEQVPEEGNSDPDPFRVYVTYSDDNGFSWTLTDPILLDLVGTIPPDAAIVTQEDISALTIFGNEGQQYVGVMWSNQLTTTNPSRFYIAIHPTSASTPTGNWTLETGFNDAFPYSGDDHIDFAKMPSGELLAVVKTNESQTASDPLVAAIGRLHNGDYIVETVSAVDTADTRPAIVVDGSTDEAYVFVTSIAGGGQICYVTSPISPLTAMDFPDARNCDPPEATGPVSRGIQLPMIVAIGDSNCNSINNAMTSKQILNAQSGVAVMATDEGVESYFHNVINGGGGGPQGSPTQSPCGPEMTNLYLPSLLKQ